MKQLRLPLVANAQGGHSVDLIDLCRTLHSWPPRQNDKLQVSTENPGPEVQVSTDPKQGLSPSPVWVSLSEEGWYLPKCRYLPKTRAPKCRADVTVKGT